MLPPTLSPPLLLPPLPPLPPFAFFPPPPPPPTGQPGFVGLILQRKLVPYIGSVEIIPIY
jgi:hypothetical protein